MRPRGAPSDIVFFITCARDGDDDDGVVFGERGGAGDSVANYHDYGMADGDDRDATGPPVAVYPLKVTPCADVGGHERRDAPEDYRPPRGRIYKSNAITRPGDLRAPPFRPPQLHPRLRIVPHVRKSAGGGGNCAIWRRAHGHVVIEKMCSEN